MRNRFKIRQNKKLMNKIKLIKILKIIKKNKLKIDKKINNKKLKPMYL